MFNDYRFYAILTLVILLATGFVQIILNIRKLNQRTSFLITYQNELVKYLNKPSEKKRQWLIERMDEAQRKLGRAGIIDNYRGPYNSFTATNYHMLVNVVMQLGTNTLHEAEIGYALDTFPRAKGLIDGLIDDYTKELKNPLKWLTRGIRFLLQLPFFILQELGVIKDSTYEKIVKNGFFHFLVGVLGLIGMIETIIGIATNKSTLLTLVTNLYSTLF